MAQRLAGWAGLLACAWATWLALPRAPDLPDGRVLHAVAVDVSASVVRTRPNVSRAFARLLREEARAALRADADLVVVTFAADVARAFGPAPASELLDRLEGRDPRPFVIVAAGGESARDRGSELDGALTVIDRVRSGAPYDDAPRPGRLTVVSDGEATGPDPAPRLASFERAGIDVSWSELPRREVGDALAVRVLAPSRLESGAALVVAVELGLRPGVVGGSCELSVTATGPGEPITRVLSTAPRAAQPTNVDPVRWSERVDLGPLADGRYEIVARVVLRDPRSGARIDAVPENDSAHAEVHVGDALLVVAVASPEDGPALRARLGTTPFPGVQIDWVEVENVATALAGADALVTFDVSPVDLPGGLLAAFVRRGGGWLATAGWRFLIGWQRDDGTSLDSASPGSASALLPLVPPPADDEPRDVVLLVDGSGSMAGEPFERVRRALFELVPAARPNDRIELRFFTQTLGPSEFSSRGMTVGERRAALVPLLEAKVPGGGTDIAYSLGRLAEERLATDVPGLCLLLTDGHSRTPGIGYRAVREQLVAAATDLRMLAMGERPNRAVLGALLLEGEVLVDAGDLSGLAELLHQEVHADRVDRDPAARARLLASSSLPPGSVARDVSAAHAVGRETGDLGALPALVRSVPVPGADVVWARADGSPVLAVQRVGSGLVAAIASAPRPGWAPFLLDDPALFDPLLRTLGRGAARGSGAARLVREGEHLVLRGVPPGWPAEVEATLYPPRERGALGQLERGLALGTIPMRIGMGGTGADPRDSRAAVRPEWLDRFPAGVGLEVELWGSAAEELARLTYRTGPPTELDAEIVCVDRTPVAPVRAASEPENTGDPDPRAPWFLGLGLLLLSCSGLGRAGKSQEIETSSRQ
ncbi:MAG: VWA domain-containing protein [bacterium]|nr:VWA domain-containing protein [bacterium]